MTTAEVAAVMTPNNAAPDLGAAEDALIALAAAGGARRVAVGNDALWASADRAAERLLRAALAVDGQRRLHPGGLVAGQAAEQRPPARA